MCSATDLENYRSVIRDRKIWLYIFGKEKPDFDNAQSYYRYINNTINLAFVYAFSCVKEMYNIVEDIEEKKKLFNPNAKRAIKNIDRIYNGFDVNYELINYIMLDVQFDLALGAESCLKQYIPGIASEFNVLDYSPHILHWMTTSKYEENITISDLIKLFQSLISSLPFISNTSLHGDKYETFFETQVGFERKMIYTDYKLFIQDCGRGYYQLYFLERVDAKLHSLTLCYSTPDYADKYLLTYHDKSFKESIDSDNCDFVLSDLNDIELICNRVTGADTNDIFSNNGIISDGISNIYTVNYKYLKNLSLSISDELGRSDNTLCRDKVLQKYGIDPYGEYDLDSVVIMQLIERLPSTVLFDLFCIDGNAFHSVIRNLYNRFNCKIKFKYIDFSQNPVDYSDLDRHLLKSLKTGHGAYHYMEMAEHQTNYILSMILANSRESETGVERVSDVIGYINTNRSLDMSQEVCAKLLIKLCCFYRGVIAYGRKKMEYDAEYYDSMPSMEKTKEIQERFRKTFLNAAEYAYKSAYSCNLSSDSQSNFAYAIDSFIELVNQVDNDIDLRKALKCVLGKNSIVDNNQLGLTSGIVSLSDDEQITQILRVLKYLTTGSFDKNESRGDFNSSIYPITGRYVSNSESNDQCSIANFQIRIDVNADGQFDYMKTINILTEFYYQIDEYYYCLPNIGRSNLDWWIDPLIVNTSEFDSIFA